MIFMCEMMRAICVDFDGVLNNYQYYDEDDLYDPYPGAKEFLEKLKESYYVIIFTARDSGKVEEWLQKYGMPYNEVTNIKQPAEAYVDDRAICFEGSYEAILNKLEDFEPFHRRREMNQSCLNCLESISCEVGQICELTKEKLRDRNFKACDEWK